MQVPLCQQPDGVPLHDQHPQEVQPLPGGHPGWTLPRIHRHRAEQVLHLFSWLNHRVANDSRPSQLINYKIMVKLNIVVVLLCHDHDVVVD